MVNQVKERNDIIAHISTLPTPTHVYEQVTSMLADARASAKDVAFAVSADQGITARLLKLVNSPFYGFPEKITTVSRAITIIGFEALRNLVLASSVMDLFQSKHRRKALFNLDHLWIHSLATGVAARAIARRVGRLDPEECLVAGLMHDIGKAVLLEYFPDEIDAILDVVRKEKCLFIDGERRVLGTDHTQLGAAVAEHWRLPTALRETIRMHHQPMEAVEPARAAAVHLADILARSLLLGSGGDRSMPALNAQAYSLLKLNDDRLHDIMADLERGMANDRVSPH
ncbi:MAG: HDOD domain-containing protein [Chloroflexota bacterium]